MSTTPTIFTYTNGTTSTSNDTTITASSYSIPSGFDLSSVVLGEGVLALGNSVFYNRPLKSITFCSTITTLGSDSLHKTQLGPLVIPNQVTTLGNAFAAENPNMTSITLPAGATRIPDYAFYGSNLSSIVFPPDASNQYTYIGAFAFQYNKFTTFTMPNTITEVGSRAFDSCTLMTTINFSSALTTIRSFAFLLCTSLNNITIPTTLTLVENDIFNSCSSLTTAYVPDLFPALPVGLFSNCTSLVSVRLPAASARNGHTSIPSYFCLNCTSLTTITFPNPNPYTTIGSIAFQGCTSLTTLPLPEGIVSLGDNAFNGCTLLSNITWPTTLTTIGDATFTACGFTSVYLPDTITSVAGAAFQQCNSLTTIRFSSGMTSVPNVVVQFCTALTSVIFPTPNNITSFGGGAFWYCTALANFTIPEGVVTMNNEVFKGCTNLVNVSFPSTLKNILYNCFEGCNKLASVVLPSGMSNNGTTSTLGTSIFLNCTSLTSITLPSTMITIPQRLCYGCSALNTIVWPPSPILKTIGVEAFRSCGFVSVTLPEGLTTLGDNAFDTCSLLTTIRLPSTLITIGVGALSNNPLLVNLTIPASVTTIGAYFGYGQTGLGFLMFESHTNITSFSTATPFFNGVSQRVEIRFASASSYSQLTSALQGAVTNLSSRSNFVFKYGPPCFLKGTLIQCKKDDHECWRPVESLRKGDLVKTLLHGFLPIDVIGTKIISNPADDVRTDVRLYKYSKEKVADLFEDLIITGTHSVLVSDLTDIERAETERVLGKIYVTDNHYRLPACADQRSEPWAKGGDFEIYHFALEHADYYMNYGVFANGLLVESSSKRYIKEISGMKLLE